MCEKRLQSWCRSKTSASGFACCMKAGSERTTTAITKPSLTLGPKPALRTADEIRERYGRPAKPADVAGAMGENLDKLRERGEKLNTLQDKTQRLESQAQDFAASAAKLREQQEAKSFFGLFS